MVKAKTKRNTRRFHVASATAFPNIRVWFARCSDCSTVLRFTDKPPLGYARNTYLAKSEDMVRMQLDEILRWRVLGNGDQVCHECFVKHNTGAGE